MQDKRASGTVVEALLDKGRGYVSTIMVQAGTLKLEIMYWQEDIVVK